MSSHSIRRPQSAHAESETSSDQSPIEPLQGIEDWARILNCSRRVVERMRSAGKLPRPDLTVGKMPRWKAATIRAWIESGGKGVA